MLKKKRKEKKRKQQGKGPTVGRAQVLRRKQFWEGERSWCGGQGGWGRFREKEFSKQSPKDMLHPAQTTSEEPLSFPPGYSLRGRRSVHLNTLCLLDHVLAGAVNIVPCCLYYSLLPQTPLPAPRSCFSHLLPFLPASPSSTYPHCSCPLGPLGTDV